MPTQYTTWWLERGWEVMPEPSPMLRATLRGRDAQDSMMELATGSLATQLTSHFTAAAEEQLANGEQEDRDEIATLPLSLGGLPKWNSHSCRRGGAKKARNMGYLWPDADEREYSEDINRHFGWLEEAMKGGKKRQVAYAGTLPVGRRTRVTSKW